MSNNNSQGQQGFGFIIIASIICIGISFVQTAYGYESLFGFPITWVVSGIISLFMLRSNLALNQARINNTSYTGIILFYLAITSISFIGNFNAFYSRFMKTELYGLELKEYQSDIPALADNAITLLSSSNNYQELERQVRGELTSLMSQVQNPSDPGLGNKAKQHKAKIEQLLNVSLTVTAQGDYAQMAANFERDVNRMLEDAKKTMNSNVDPLIAQIQERKVAALETVNAAVDPSFIQTEGKAAIIEAVRTYNFIGESTANLLPSFEFTKRVEQNTSTGKLDHSLRSGFIKWDNPQATFISGIASLFIDFLVPIYIFLTVTPGSGGGSSNSGGGNSSNNGSSTPIPGNSFLDRIRGGGKEPGIHEL